MKVNGTPFEIECDICKRTFIRYGMGRLSPNLVEKCFPCTLDAFLEEDKKLLAELQIIEESEE
jgi:hypothetical protein